MDRDLYMYLDRHIKPYYTDTNIAFIPAFTNNFKTSSLPETKFDMSKSAQTTLGVSLGIPVYNSTDSADTEITAQFNPDLRKSIIKYIDMIFKYSKSKKEGNTIPYAKIAKHNVIDISTTIFMFVVGPDGVTLESYYRSVGVVPSANPVTSIPLTSSGERMDTINVSFKCNTNLDSRKVSIIEHFNLLNRMGCSKIKAHSSNPDLTFEKLKGKIKTYDEAIDWYLVNRNVLDIIMDDNMKVGDWYTERFIIHADPANGRNEYKMVAIPKADRLYELLKFVLSTTPAAKRFTDVAGRHPNNKTNYFRNNINALYQKYQLNADKIEELLRNADDRGGGKQNLDRKYRLNDSMTRMMNKVSRSVMNDFETSEESISIVTGERTFGDMNKNVVSAKNSAEWVMNIFREVDIDSQLGNSRMRPPITTIFSSRDDKKLEVGPGFGELKRLIEKSSKVTNGVKHDGGFTNIAFPQLAAFASVHGGFVEFLPLDQLSLNHKDYVKQIQSGNSSVFVGINRAINDKKNKWSLEAFDLDTSKSNIDTLKATSEEFELYNKLNPLIGKPKKNPLQVGKDAVFSESGILLLGDPVGMTAMTAYENAVEKEFTQTSIEGMNPNHHDVDDDGFIWVRDFNSSNAVTLIKNEMLYGLNILQDRKFLELLMSTNFGKNEVPVKLNGLDSNNLIRAYWMHAHEKEWNVNNKEDSKVKEQYFGESPADMTFEIVKDVVPGSDASNYTTLKPIPGRHQPFFEMRDEKLHVFRTKAVIRYVNRDDPTVIWYKTNDKVQMLTSILDGTYPDKDTFKAYYNMDEDGTLDQAGHEIISLFDKSVMLPSMK